MDSDPQADPTGLIKPDMFVAKAASLNTSLIAQAARDLRSMGRKVSDEVSSISTSWSALKDGETYQSPHQDRVYDLMAPAVTSADDLEAVFDAMATHLETYRGTLWAIKPRLTEFETRAAAFRSKVVGGVMVDGSSKKSPSIGDSIRGAFDFVPLVNEKKVRVPWYEDRASCDMNEGLLAEYAGLLAEISEASTLCANSINALVVGTTIDVATAYQAEQFTDLANPMPWGTPREEDRNCSESARHGAESFGTGLWDGARALVVGYNPQTGGYFETADAWRGLGDLAESIAAVAVFGIPANLMIAFGRDDNAFSDYMGERSTTFITVLGSFVGYDASSSDGWHKWKEDAVSTGTESALTLATFFIPSASASNGLKAGSAASRAAAAGAVAADVVFQGGSWAVKGGVKVSAALGDVLRFGDDLAGVSGQVVQSGGRLSWSGGTAGLIDAVAGPTPVTDSLFGPAKVSPSSGSTSSLYDPNAPVRETVNQSSAPKGYGAADVETAWRDAPVDAQGRPVDHRTGTPLIAENLDGNRGWHMKWDPEGGQWVAENPGTGALAPGHLPLTGEPGSFGYDSAGNRMPYANSRPDYAPGQEIEVWRGMQNEKGEVWVEGPEGQRVQIIWKEGDPRQGVWDMGHVPDQEYRLLRDDYLSHKISLEDFLGQYRTVDNYQVEHPSVNRSRSAETN